MARTATRGRPMDGQRARGRRPRQRRLRPGVRSVPGSSSRWPARRSLPARRMCAPAANAPIDRDVERARSATPGSRVRVLDRDDRVRPGRHRRAGQDAHGSPSLDGDVRARAPAATSPMTRSARATRNVRSQCRPRRTAKPSIALLSHGGRVVRDVDLGREHAAERIVERDLLRRQRRRGRRASALARLRPTAAAAPSARASCSCRRQRRRAPPRHEPHDEPANDRQDAERELSTAPRTAPCTAGSGCCRRETTSCRRERRSRGRA